MVYKKMDFLENIGEKCRLSGFLGLSMTSDFFHLGFRGFFFNPKCPKIVWFKPWPLSTRLEYSEKTLDIIHTLLI